ncbi:ROK family protein [Pelagibacterium halotolerans]|uniref:N-acetylmannosamine-6-phosphate 2-epimerase / N-acetylmannosamine kinase n=1 Tax=Pelagibacterium halotolerans (strain DSM 22347 / JCM 15775 / CGMCC 1.7692 / B2) TaxID=1082931 RepID=G4RG98_PELHB|nr:ROK family protein [Pelagibacterium halotolerans]AEQ53074.1 N-acetylmannosamine-6-phosphate 2-epimerase / N-acetylmannosamine kinase [Pelagibacterium halotolerans B2]SEA87314.1 N-acylmannosamine kinase/N-acetylmannosamine-6-phosphate 2-epimerase / N-acetylmannosamine kinase [Pelagibacterium halotolerans]
MANSAPTDTVLAIDIGGTKILGALVSGTTITEPVEIATPGSGDPRSWIADLFGRAPNWHGRYGRVGAAVTGVVEDGHWSALNPKTLSIPSNYPLTEVLGDLAGAPAIALNDAQAAAWGEYRLGAGRGAESCVFLTISTGIGGGVVAGGQLLSGMAGHFGQFRADIADETPIESLAAGRWMAEAAQAQGYPTDARGVFAAAAQGDAWAESIIALSAGRIATLCANIQLGLAPERIIIGGSIGLAPGFIARIAASFSDLPPRQRPVLVAAQLGGQAGIVGIAQIALPSN